MNVTDKFGAISALFEKNCYNDRLRSNKNLNWPNQKLWVSEMVNCLLFAGN